MKPVHIFIIDTIATAVLVLDQLTKWWVLQHPHAYGEPGDFFQLTLVYNRGVAFSLPFEGLGWYLAFILVICIIIYAWRSYFQFNQVPTQIAFGLLIGGAFGNLVDKIRFDAVVDFIGISIWPFFNIADIAITSSVLILLIFHKITFNHTTVPPAP